jgi:Na+-driven multidrug efflux pump
VVRDRDFYRTIFKIAVPAALQSLISFLVVVADDVMVSALPYGVKAQAAVSQVNSITAFYTATILGLVSGSSVLISQYWGKHDMVRIKRIFSIVTLFCLGLSLIFVAAAVFFPRSVVGIVLASGDQEVVSLALSYFSVACFTYIPFAVTSALVGMLRTIEVVRITLYTAILSLLTNVVFNYLFIFGKMGFPALGVTGAAIATLIARLVELLAVWIYTFKVQKRLEIKPRELLHIDRQMAGDYARYGLPVGLTDM